MFGHHRIYVALGGAAMVVAGILSQQPDPVDRVVFLAVGQGDCAVIQSQGLTALVDAAPASEGIDLGERLVVPELRRLGVRRVDLVFISHADMDHMGGLVGISTRYDIGKVVISSAFRGHSELHLVLQRAGIKAEQVIWLSGTRTIQIGRFSARAVTPRVIGPSNDNDLSMFLRVTQGASEAVFTGDASIWVEQQVAIGDLEWRADVLKCGHHGSRTATGFAWLYAVQPDVAVISCGRGNQFRHPSADTLARLKVAGVPAIRTDREGAIEYRPTSNGFRRFR